MSNYYGNEPRRSDAATDMNRDPLTGEPGAHPVGVGVGAAAGAGVGAAVGAIGGPVGVAAGAAVGGVVGGLMGKATAEAVNPTAEVEYWRAAFKNRPYASGRTFEDYEPAYYSTAAAYPTYAGRAFEEIEPDLERAWTTNRRSSRLDWSEARRASQDAWERVATRYATRTPNADSDSASVANDLIEFLYDGAHGFKQAAKSVKAPQLQSGLQRFAEQRESFIAELKPLVTSRGERAETSGTMTGSLHRGWIGLKNALSSGDRPILAECERGEDAAVAKYRQALESTQLPPDVRSVIQKQYAEIKRAHDTVRAWRDTLAS